MSVTAINVLFVGAHNATRSLIAEGVANRVGAGKFRAFSAGRWPTGRIDPRTMDLLRLQNYDLSVPRCKSVIEFARSFARPDAPDLDFVFTLSDAIPADACPPWPGQPVVAHWDMPDPAETSGSEAEIRCAFADCHRMLYQRIGVFASLPLTSLSRLAVRELVALIARQIDATATTVAATAE